MELSLARPIFYASVANLWNDVTLLINGIVPPKSGEPTATRVELATIDADTEQPVVVKLPVKDGAFPYTAVELMVTVSPNDVGTATVSFSRDEDPPGPAGQRPTYSTKTLTRQAGGALLIDIAFSLEGK
jgi:hypothetical protein